LRFTVSPKHGDLFQEKLRKDIGRNMDPLEVQLGDDYRHTGVLRRCIDYHYHDSNGLSTYVVTSANKRQKVKVTIPTLDWFDLSNDQHTDSIPNMPDSEFDDLAIDRKGPTLLFEGSMASHLSNADMTMALFDSGCIVQVVSKCGKKKIPVIHQVPARLDTASCQKCDQRGERCYQYPIPGELYFLGNICADVGLVHSDRAHPAYCSDDGTHPITILKHSYKNDADSVNTYMEELERWKKDRSLPLFTDDFDGVIRIHGSGGSPELQGNYAPTPKRDTKDDPYVTVPAHQPMNTKKSGHFNTSLMNMSLYGSVVSIYVNRSLFAEEFLIVVHDEASKKQPKSTNSQPELGLHLGTFYCSEFNIGRRPVAEVAAKFRGCGPRRCNDRPWGTLHALPRQ